MSLPAPSCGHRAGVRLGLACAAVLAGTVLTSTVGAAAATTSQDHGAFAAKAAISKKGAVSKWGDDATHESARASKSGTWLAEKDHG